MAATYCICILLHGFLVFEAFCVSLMFYLILDPGTAPWAPKRDEIWPGGIETNPLGAPSPPREAAWATRRSKGEPRTASGGPRGWVMDHFGLHFGVHFGVLLGPFRCLDSDAFLASFRVPPGFHLGSFWNLFLTKLV